MIQVEWGMLIINCIRHYDIIFVAIYKGNRNLIAIIRDRVEAIKKLSLIRYYYCSMMNNQHHQQTLKLLEVFVKTKVYINCNIMNDKLVLKKKVNH